MKTKKRQITEQSEPLSFEPSNEPRTIPTGWDVTSFYKFRITRYAQFQPNHCSQLF